jgi:hypothetical protein
MTRAFLSPRNACFMGPVNIKRTGEGLRIIAVREFGPLMDRSCMAPFLFRQQQKRQDAAY